MADLIHFVIHFVLANYFLTFFVIGLVFATIAIVRSPPPRPAGLVAEKLISWFVFWTIGVGFFYNFIMHGLFGRMSAAFIGWENSPFQFEVATASLGFAAVGFIAAFRSFELRLGAILGPAIFLLGAAGGHIYQMVAAHNFAPGNAGVIFYMDIIIPVTGFLLLWLQSRLGRPVAGPAPRAKPRRLPATTRRAEAHNGGPRSAGAPPANSPVEPGSQGA